MSEDSLYRKKEICLGDDGKPSHGIYFLAGEATAIFCPVLKKRILMREIKPKAIPTDRQGQYLAFIYYYTKLNGCAPSERDMECFFRAQPPTVHQMVLTLEKKGFISRSPGKARSISLLLNRSEFPDLE